LENKYTEEDILNLMEYLITNYEDIPFIKKFINKNFITKKQKNYNVFDTEINSCELIKKRLKETWMADWAMHHATAKENEYRQYYQALFEVSLEDIPLYLQNEHAIPVYKWRLSIGK